MAKSIFAAKTIPVYRDWVIFLVVFGLIMVKYCAFGFQYWPQLDDYIQYHNYAQFYGQTWDTVTMLGMLAARPLAGLADLFFWSNFFDHMLLGVALVSLMYAASAVLLRRIFAKYFGTGILFVIFLTLFPLVTEGTYWMSASTRIVTGLFFAVLASVFFVRWLEKKGNPLLSGGLFMIFQLLAYGFYEQVLVFSVTLILLLAFLERKNAGCRLWLCLWSIVAAGLYFIFTAAFSESLLYSGRIETVPLTSPYYWDVFFPELITQLKSAFFGGGFYILCKGFLRGMGLIVSEKLILFLLALLVLAVVLWQFSRSESRQVPAGTEVKVGTSLIIGILLALAPLAPFFITANPWFSLRGTVLSMVGLSLVGDTLLRLLLAKILPKTNVAPIFACIMAVVFVVAGISEVADYRDTHNNDVKIARAVLTAVEEDDVADMEIGILNIEPTYLSDQNFYYHEHIHGVTESQWAFTGALRCIGGNGSLQSVTPLPTDPVYKSWNADVSRPEKFDRLYYYDEGENAVIPVVAETLEEQRYCILTEDGDLLGTLWEEDGNGYFQKE